MKKPISIIRHLKSTPSFQKLNEQQYFNKLKDILPSSLKKGIKFIYKKDNILFFVLTHNLFLNEFNYNLKLINKLLKELEMIEGISLEIKSIKGFISKKKLPKNKKELNTEIFYKEVATGNFKNSVKDENLKKIFENIRENIYKNRK